MSRHANVGAAFGVYVDQSTVRAAKDSLDPFVQSLDEAAYACDAFGPKRAAWSRWVIAWNKFFTAEEGFLTAGSEMDEFERYERTFKNWEADLGRQCTLNSVPYSSRGDQPAPPLAAPLMWIGIGAGVLGLAWIVSSAVTSAGGIAALLPKPSARRAA